LSKISQVFLEQYFANMPFEKSIFVYPQNLWITLWMALLYGALIWRGVRGFVTLLIFYNVSIAIKNNELS
jgi:hypothetical protein